MQPVDGQLDRIRRKRFAVNAASSWMSNAAKTGLQLVMLPVMAHLLGPAAFGVYAVALPVVVFFVTLAESGLGLSLAKEDEANTIVWSTAFWLVVITFSLMALCVAGSGPVLTRWTGHPEYALLMPLLALALPLMAVTVTPDARITRRGDLRLHSVADASSAFLAAAVAITAALRGWGVWSLAFQYVTIFLVRAILYNAVVRIPPRFEFELGSLKGHLGMSASILVRRIGDLIGRSAETALFQRAFGVSALGSYSLALQVSRFGCEAFTNPVTGALYSHVLHLDGEGARRAHARVLKLLAFALLPVAVLGAVCGPRLLPILLGPKWVAAAAMFPPLLVCYAVAALSGLVDPLLMLHRRTGISTAVVVAGAFGRVAVVALGGAAGLRATVWMLAATYLVQAVALTILTPRSCREGLGRVAAALGGACIASAAAACAAAVVLTRGHSLETTMAALAVGLVVYGAAMLLLEPDDVRRYAGSSLAGLIRRPA